MSPSDAGYRRERKGDGFIYRRADGARIRDAATLERIRRLAIPPAWTDVWICAAANGHLQATGHDARGRKQYRYHADWREARDADKFGRLSEFGRALPAIRRQVARDLRRPPLSREAVLATLVRLLETTLIRVGNEEYARANGSYGLTTLRDRHVRIGRQRVRIRFRGKSGKAHDIELHDRRLAARLRRLQDLPGQDLFLYEDEAGQRHTIRSDDVNDYLHEIAGNGFSAKDFRTWAGTLAAASWLSRERPREGQLTKRQINEMIAQVAAQLGNTPAICRKSYIHPTVIERGRRGAVLAAGTCAPVPRAPATGLSAAERALLRFLRSPDPAARFASGLRPGPRGRKRPHGTRARRR
ncbi:MAG TPA: DNA topoisomerase IB [Lacunisphaera sp.]|nr:DNA topoisomerase IB [Lacunisphaera sp.]